MGTIQRKEKSRVSLILEETFENEETKNEINDMIIQMAEKAKLSPTLEMTEEEEFDTVEPPNSVVTVVTTTTQLNNNDTQFKLESIESNGDGVDTTNPWDLVPDQPRIKTHSRTNSTTNPADRWLASLTARISDLQPPVKEPVNGHGGGGDPMEEEWAALANRNVAKAASTNPFRACV